MIPAMQKVRLLAAHGEQVLHLPPAAKVLGSNTFCAYASLAIGSTVFTTQYHPELSADFMQDLLVELETSLPLETVEAARVQLAAHPKDDSEHFMHWIANFIEQART
jgi:GMP synthase-like glutamine amidotransferase